MSDLDLMTVSEVAAELRCDRETVARMVRAGELSAINIGGDGRPSWRVNRADLLAWLETRRAKSEAAR